MFVVTIVMIFQAFSLVFFIRYHLRRSKWPKICMEFRFVRCFYRCNLLSIVELLFDTFFREISPNGFGWTNGISFRNFSSFSVLFKPEKSKSIFLQQFWRKEFVTFHVGRTAIDLSKEGKQGSTKFCLCSTCLLF